VQRAQELAERAGERRAGRLVEPERLAARHVRRPEERPRELVHRAADEHGIGDRERHARREHRQSGELALEPGERDLAAREAEHPAAVRQPHRVVPALAQQLQRTEFDLRELLRDEPPRERLVDLHLCCPNRHSPQASHATG
jgi:hypothetical protein